MYLFTLHWLIQAPGRGSSLHYWTIMILEHVEVIFSSAAWKAAGFQRVDPINQGISSPVTIPSQPTLQSSAIPCLRFHHFILFIGESKAQRHQRGIFSGIDTIYTSFLIVLTEACECEVSHFKFWTFFLTHKVKGLQIAQDVLLFVKTLRLSSYFRI